MNSECERVVPLLGPMFDGRLLAPVRGALIAHVRTCASCLAVARDLKRLAVEADRVASESRARADLSVRTRAIIEARHPGAFSASRLRRGWRGAPRALRFAVGVLAASVVFASVFVAGYWRGRHDRMPSGLDSTATIPEFAFGEGRWSDGSPAHDSTDSIPMHVLDHPAGEPVGASDALSAPVRADVLMRAWLEELERQASWITPRPDAGSSPPQR